MDQLKRRGPRILAMWQMIACILLASCSRVLALDPSQDVSRYDRRQFRLRVRDDGKGIDEASVRRGHAGHFGLHGMRERAEIVGGRLEVWSEHDTGTEVELSIPGAVAYSVQRSWFSKVFSRKSRNNESTEP
jgi:hypothetical protein